MNLTSPATVMTEMVKRLRAAVIPAGLSLAGEALFTEVQPFDLSDMAEALEKLLMVGDRVAVVVLESAPATVTLSGTNLVTRISYDFAVMFADRNLADRNEAMLGSATNPGALNLVPAIIEACSGDYGGPICRAGGEPGRLLVLTGEDGTNNFDRVCYRQPFVVSGGQLRQTVGRGAQF